jgi:hypothetical protein
MKPAQGCRRSRLCRNEQGISTMSLTHTSRDKACYIHATHPHPHPHINILRIIPLSKSHSIQAYVCSVVLEQDFVLLQKTQTRLVHTSCSRSKTSPRCRYMWPSLYLTLVTKDYWGCFILCPLFPKITTSPCDSRKQREYRFSTLYLLPQLSNSSPHDT